MKSDHAISETISTILIILMVLILAIIITGLILGANIFQQKSALIASDIKSQTLYSKNIITIFHRAGDEVYLNSSLSGLHEMGIYVDNKSFSWRALPVPGLNIVKPGATLFIYYNASKNTYRITTNAATLNTSEAQSVVDCPLKIRLVDEKAHLLITTWNWTCTPPLPVPRVTSISPTSGPVTGGTTVTITGTGFTSASNVSFGSTPATSVTYLSATQIRASSPAHAVGIVDVLVTTSGGTSAVIAGDRFTYLPVIFSLLPTSGPSGGGTNVTITGAGFTSASTVSFGGTAGTNVTYLSATQIIATSPARPTGGTVDVRVTTATFTSAIVFADQFTYTGVLPSITSITPTSGPVAGGTTVTINGIGFINGSTVRFGGTPGTSVTFVSATRLTARSPAGAAGVVDVTVTTTGGTSLVVAADQFTYAGIPTVTGISPASGPPAGGIIVTITGTGFTNASTVSFGGTAGTSVSYVNPTQITVRAPARLGGGTVDVRVTTTGGTSATSAADRFTYTGVLPAITSISPTSGRLAGATTVTITGTGFTDASTVSFGGTPGTSVTYLSATQLRVSSPSRTAGVVDVRVTTAEGISPIVVPADQYTYLPIPTVSGISPSNGVLAGGTLVTITGTGFASGSTVSFGGIAGTSVAYVDPTHITVRSPARLAGGTVDVTVATTGGISATSAADRFTYLGVAPTITSLSPASGPPAGGTVVTITGTGFTDASTVSFGGTAGTSVTYISATQIRVNSPARAAGVVDVRVTTAEDTSAIVIPADQFTYVPIPTITSILPASGSPAGGTTVTITGTGFTPASTVSFGGTAGTSVTYDSPTQIRVTSPARLGGGTVDVRVTTTGVTSAVVAADRFTYSGIAPAVSSISPASGPLAGGTAVTITGTGFTYASTVSFGGTPGTSVTYLSATQIRANSPARLGGGTVDITVTTADGTSAIVAGDQFTYVTVPTVSGLSLASGPPAGGTVVTITGTGFTSASTVSFGGTAGTSVTYLTPTQITVRSPARVGGGTVDVTVATTGVASATSAADRFTYINVPPIVSSISPASGPLAGATVVTITGTGFTDTSTVSFGGIPTGVTYLSATQIRVTSPAGVAGVVELTVTTADGTSASVPGDRFTYVPIPTVSSLLPATGPVTGGTSVIITGTGFTSGSTVSFGGVGGTGMICYSPTQITVNSPSRASTGVVDVRVTTTGVTSAIVAGDRFTYT